MSTDVSDFYVLGGTIPRDSPAYVARRADVDLMEGLRRGQFCYVLTSRQMGKSSLMVRTAMRLREEHITCVVLDLTSVGQNLTEEQWYDGLLSRIAAQLDLEDALDDFWMDHKRLGPLQRWMEALKAVVLKQVSGPVVLFVDEIDAVRSLPFSADEFFAAIRECYNRRTEDPDYARLTFCLIGVATPSDLIRDTRTTPFNIGRRIELTDFTLEEAAPLEPPNLPSGGLGRILYWTGGHPYLTQRLCQAVGANHAKLGYEAVDHQCEELFLASGARERDANLLFVRDRILRSEVDRVGLLETYGQIWAGKRVRDDEANPLLSVLRLSGIVRAEGSYLRVRNRIYARVFDRAWIRTNMPDAELRRQKMAYRRGFIRAAVISAVIIMVTSGLAVIAVRNANLAATSARIAREETKKTQTEKSHAEREAEAARRNLYAANMSLAQQAWNNQDYGHVYQLLEELKPEPGQTDLRGFEWGFLWRRGHFDLPFLPLQDSYVYTAVTFSPDGKSLAVGDGHGSITLWDRATGTPIRSIGPKAFSGKEPMFTGDELAFSPDGKTLAVSTKPMDEKDNLVNLYDTATGELVKTFRGAHAPVAFAPDGKTLAAGDGYSALVWDAASGEKRFEFRGSTTLRSLAYAPDGTLLATGDYQDTITLWDMKSGKAVRTIKPDFHMPFVDLADGITLAFSPDGKRLAAGRILGEEDPATLRGSVKIWEVATGRLVQTIPNANGPVAYSPDGAFLATGERAHTIVLREAATGKQYTAFPSASAPIAFAPDSKTLATRTNAYGWGIKLWDTARREPQTVRGSWDKAGLSKDGKLLATSDWEEKTITLRDAVTLQPLGTLNVWRTPQDKTPLPQALLPDGKTLVREGDQGELILFDARTNTERERWVFGDMKMLGILFSSDGRLMVHGGNGGEVQLWDVATKRLLHTFPKAALLPAFSPDGKLLAFWEQGKGVELYEVATGNRIGGLAGAQAPIAFSPDGAMIATGGEKNTVLLWDAVSKQKLLTFKGYRYSMHALAFSPDGKRLAAGDGGEYTVRIWDTTSGREVFTIPGITDRTDVPSYSLFFSPDGKRLYSGNQNNTLKVWEAASP